MGESERLLQSLVNYEIQLRGASPEQWAERFRLERFRSLLGNLGHPQKQFRSIQIAGTNGKGTTAAYASHILRVLGYRVGSFYSPHLLDIRERIQMNGSAIEDSRLCEYIYTLRGKGEYTFFEALTACAWMYFADEKVDVAVLETGLGGRLDAVSFAKASIGAIVSIGLDHTHILGHTGAKILWEKWGMVHPDMDLLIGSVKTGLYRQIAHRKGFISAKSIRWMDRDFTIRRQSDHRAVFLFDDYKIRILLRTSPPSFLRPNLSVALAAALRFTMRYADSVRPESRQKETITEAIRRVDWSMSPLSGRLESIGRYRNIRLLFDGAHNVNGLRSFTEYLRENQRDAIVFLSFLRDKKLSKGVYFLVECRYIRSVYLWTPNCGPREWISGDDALLLCRRYQRKLSYIGTGAETLSNSLRQIVDRAIHSGNKPSLISFLGSLYSYREVVEMVKGL